MKTTKKEKKTSNVAGVLGVIGGLAAAATVGAYFVLNSKDAKKKIKNVKGWALKAKGDVLDKLEDMKDVTESKYKSTVDSVLSKYGKIKKVEAPEILKLAEELKSHWKTISRELSAGAKSIKKTANKTAKVTKTIVSK